MDWKKFVEKGKTINCHTMIKGKKAVEEALKPKQLNEVHTEIYAPGTKIL